ncbi:hypothetical protein CYMTET_31663 [Cymbomonas tetramitiformis]|uniref:Uncharacterized protein n=1 Tax=Cymbomonas tetramitiformis TaxID=36881 RepID=A0AAE0FH34_9CHLO|nr:hypothetical protein CYMTET_31663 [Cymbomonas tetramitiformis]
MFTPEMSSRVLRGRNFSAERERKSSTGDRQRNRGPRCWLHFNLHGGHRLIVADKHKIMRIASVPATICCTILEPVPPIDNLPTTHFSFSLRT